VVVPACFVFSLLFLYVLFSMCLYAYRFREPPLKKKHGGLPEPQVDGNPGYLFIYVKKRNKNTQTLKLYNFNFLLLRF